MQTPVCVLHIRFYKVSVTSLCSTYTHTHTHTNVYIHTKRILPLRPNPHLPSRCQQARQSKLSGDEVIRTEGGAQVCPSPLQVVAIPCLCICLCTYVFSISFVSFFFYHSVRNVFGTYTYTLCVCVYIYIYIYIYNIKLL